MPLHADITFFGEPLPARFHRCRLGLLPKADLLLVLGTSLSVQPVAGMLDEVGPDVPRVLINLHHAGSFNSVRDSVHLGDCDSAVIQLAELLGWATQLADLIAAGDAALKEARESD